jgi:hypothetical protein
MLRNGVPLFDVLSPVCSHEQSEIKFQYRDGLASEQAVKGNVEIRADNSIPSLIHP